MVSVIIPTYNSARFLPEALTSVFQQTHKDYEVLVIDDGSTDETREIVEHDFPEVRYFYIPNQGVAKARNYGIGKAGGEFIAFLDADDIWLPEKLEKQIAALHHDPSLMLVFTEQHYFDKSGPVCVPIVKRDTLMQGDIVKNIFSNSYLTTSTVMVRKSVFDTVGYFEEGLKAAEDDNLWLRIALKFKIDLIDEVLIHYRITEGSLSQISENILVGVGAHIKLIETKYPELKKRLGRIALRRKRAGLYFSNGYYLFSRGKSANARGDLLRSLFYFPSEKALLYFLCTFLPESAISRVRAIKKKQREGAPHATV